MKDYIVKPLVLFLTSLFILLGIIAFLWLTKTNEHAEVYKYIKILGAFCASGISIAIPGMIEIKNGINGVETLASRAPNVTATGALAVFVFVYLV
ncbi:hypothetical protein [Winogradskyella algicola]|uniref:hypothetical protein n=1 Tax=Winogradskyella algicola TaxID=2575815 RepID=UPI0011089BDE|nr:hypothetical protein [Winogradskyella algicola]